MWHMTEDIWHITGGVKWIFSQNFSSLAHTVLNIWIKRLTQSVDDGGVCRTAPATPGLLMTLYYMLKQILPNYFLLINSTTCKSSLVSFLWVLIWWMMIRGSFLLMLVLPHLTQTYTIGKLYILSYFRGAMLDCIYIYV